MKKETPGLGAKENEEDPFLPHERGERTKLKVQSPHDLTSKIIMRDAGLPGA